MSAIPRDLMFDFKQQPQIKVVKPEDHAIISSRKSQLLRRIENAQSEVGRLNKLLDEIRADVLRLTVD